MNNMDGIAEFYQGESGKKFSDWQIKSTLDMAWIDADKFKNTSRESRVF